MVRLQSAVGLVAMLAIAWSLSSHRRRVSCRIVVWGVLLQFSLAYLLLKTRAGLRLFQGLGKAFNAVLAYVDEGAHFLFDIYPRDGDTGYPPVEILLRSFAFGVLPTIVFFSSLMAILYHLRLVQPIVAGLAWLMQRTLKTSGAESLSAAANIFVGQTEAPLVIRPYVAEMTRSELMAVMVGGFATIAGGVMAAYVKMGIDAGHLMTASVISAPAALVIAKIMLPETEQPKTMGRADMLVAAPSCNVIEAAAIGASDGLMLALNVGAMLVAFVALVAMANGLVALAGSGCSQLYGFCVVGEAPDWNWSLAKICGYLFYPLAWLMGVDSRDCMPAGEVLGKRLVLNEFVAYAEMTRDPLKSLISDRTRIILTYALCGFANFASIGIQIGGIGAMAPNRRGDLASIGLRAMFGGMLACFMTACIAGILID